MIYSRSTSESAIYQFIYAHYIGFCVICQVMYSCLTSVGGFISILLLLVAQNDYSPIPFDKIGLDF